MAKEKKTENNRIGNGLETELPVRKNDKLSNLSIRYV